MLMKDKQKGEEDNITSLRTSANSHIHWKKSSY